jgi:hypothetical protein
MVWTPAEDGVRKKTKTDTRGKDRRKERKR